MKLADLTLQHRKWIEKSETGVQIDLTSVTLDAEHIRDAVLKGGIFDHVTFEGLEASHCDFTASSFFDCIFSNCKFTNCTFHKAEFHDCRGEQVQSAECSFTKTEWYRGDFRQAVFADCDFSWSYLQSVDLRYAQLNDINLEGALWDSTKVYKARFGFINWGSLHPARIERSDISDNGDGATEVTLQQFRELFEK